MGIAITVTFVMPISVIQAEESYDVQPIVPTENTIRFTDENWLTLPHPEVATFTILTDGSMHGSTVTGIPFTQYNIPNELGIRVQRFEIEDHAHYIIEGEVAYTFEEFSAKLAQAYARTISGA